MDTENKKGEKVMYKLLLGDAKEKLQELEDNSVNCVVTSPPYWGLRDYGEEGQLGLEPTPQEYVQKLVNIFREIWSVLKDDGTVWLNLGDSYASGGTGGNSNKSTLQGYSSENTKNRQMQLNQISRKPPKGLKPKDLVGIPWRVAFALQDDGWYLRQDIIWHKPNPMPESVKDRCTKAHEYVFLLTKTQKYYYNHDAIKEPAAYDGRKDTKMKGSNKYKNSVIPGQAEHSMASRGHERWQWSNGIPVKNKRSVWTVNTKPCKEAHFAVFPQELINPCVLAGCPQDGVVLDPFMGRGTTGEVALLNNKHFIGIELSEKYLTLAEHNIQKCL